MLASLRKSIILFFLATIPGQEPAADSFRCGRKLISVGDSAGELARACGEPQHKERGKESLRVNGVSKDTRVELWYYKKSARSLEHIIVINKGRIAAVQVGHR
jgi:hypothetical protein